MKTEILNLLQIAFFLVVLSCLVSIMALFMGGGQASTDLRSLLNMQTAAVLFGLAVFVTVSVTSDFRAIWRALPQWLVFIALLLNTLALCGEIALVVAARMTGHVGPWQEHVPLVCVIVCSIAFLLLYAKTHPVTDDQPAMSGRW